MSTFLPDYLQPSATLTPVGCLPAGQRCSEHQVVVVRLSPVLITDMCGYLVLLAPEVEEFLPKLWPPLKPLGHLQGALVERHLQGRDEILLRYTVLTRTGTIHLLAEAGDGDGDVVKAPLLQEVGHGHPDAGLVHDEFGGGLGHPTVQEHGRSEGISGEQALDLIRYIGVGRLEGIAFQVLEVQLGRVLSRLWSVSGNLLHYGQGGVVL